MFTSIFIIISLVSLVFIILIQKRRIATLNKSNKKYFFFRKDLPFTPNYYQVIYVESDTNFALNDLVKTNYNKIQELFASKGFSFFYLGVLIDKLKNPEFYSYNFPYLNIDDKKLNTNELNYSMLLDYLNYKCDFRNGLIKYQNNAEEGYRFSFNELTETNFWNQLDSYESLYGPAANSLVKDPEDETEKADFYFDFKSDVLIDEIKQRINKLRIMGIEEMFIKSLFEFKPKLSKILITKDYRIYLPDYNKEINMHPLPKAVYILFINHPEGILFKQLPNYKKELFGIYKNITNRYDIDDVIASINDITDPTKNAINEKCSRIRSAFLEIIADDLAKNYYITGKRGEPKKIILDRAFVEYQ